jgi:hypothetical protein
MTAAGGGIGYGTEKDEVRQGAAGSLSLLALEDAWAVSRTRSICWSSFRKENTESFHGTSLILRCIVEKLLVLGVSALCFLPHLLDLVRQSDC